MLSACDDCEAVYMCPVLPPVTARTLTWPASTSISTIRERPSAFSLPFRGRQRTTTCECRLRLALLFLSIKLAATM